MRLLPNWRHPPFAACEQRGSLNRSISPPPHSGTVTEGTLARPPGLPVSWAARMVAGSTPARAHRFGADLAVGEQIGTAVVAQTAVVGRACALPQLGRWRASSTSSGDKAGSCNLHRACACRPTGGIPFAACADQILESNSCFSISMTCRLYSTAFAGATRRDLNGRLGNTLLQRGNLAGHD